ncbi:zinc finger protein 862-like isoform X1 [Ruditapes philippinarum]|uniref:zinc finger protein 862-like isoform X1 n=1 Tax=Ruditapes philippinarum TaxID=129788 RepID=UPI00295BFA54|nr:zinc finger protein 862-like isoform X1 [Ruditapes philippinarum]
MMGKKTGVGVQMKAKFSPYMTQTHCIAHRLNLAIGDAIKKNETLKKFKQMFETLYHFMSASTLRINKLKAVQDILNEPEISIKEPHSIRWLGLKKAVEAVYDCYGALLVTLSSFACDNPTAKGLHKYFSTYKSALLIGLMMDIHTELGVLSCELQRQSLVFSDVYPLLEGTVGKLEYMKEHDGNGLHEMKDSIEFKTQSDDEGEPKPFYKGESLKYYKKGNSDSEFQAVKNDYIDSLARNIKKRISKVDCNVLCSLGLLLEPASYSTECDNAVEYVAQMYGTHKVTKKTVEDVVIETPVDPLLNGDELKTEWQGIKAMVTGCYKSLSLKAFCRKIIQSSLSTSYPNFAKLAEIGLCMEVTSVECERTFSAQNRLKSKYRAALKEESLEALLTVSLIGPTLSLFKPAGSVRRWVRAKQRRKRRLTAPYKSRTLKNIMSKCV